MTISKLLGHQDVKTTYDNYIYDLEDEEEIFKDVVNALQNGASKPIQDNGTRKSSIFRYQKNRSNAVKSTSNPFSSECG